MSIAFQDGATAARPVLLDGTFPPFERSFLLGRKLGVSYDGASKRLLFEAYGGGCRLQMSDIDCSLFEAEAIAAGLLRPLERGGYRKFTPRHLTAGAFCTTGVPADVLDATMTKVTVGRGERVELPANAYLGIFRTARRRPDHQLFRLRALVGGLERDTYFDIVVFASDLLLMLTRVGYLRAISLSYGECVVALPRRLTELPAPVMVC